MHVLRPRTVPNKEPIVAHRIHGFNYSAVESVSVVELRSLTFTFMPGDTVDFGITSSDL